MKREYYIYWYRLNRKDAYLIFYYDEIDGFVIDENGFVINFDEVSDVIDYSKRNHIKVDVENPNLLDLDIVQNWMNNSDNKIENYNPFLEAWNLFEDISISINENFDKEKEVTNNLYNRIFWGCNIPTVTPEGESFTPTWTKKELKIIRKTLNFGFQMFREKTKKQ